MIERVVQASDVRKSGLIGAVAFVATTALVLLTFHPVVVILWVTCWVFAGTFGGPRPHQKLFLLIIGIIFFYPEFTTAFHGYHEKWVVLAVVLVSASVFLLPLVKDVLRRHELLTVVVVLWIGWGLVAYLPVLGAYIWATVMGNALPPFLSSLQHTTSGLKSAAPIIPAALIALLTVAALRTTEDLRRFRRALTIAVLIITSGSIVLWALDVRILPFDDVQLIPDTTRLGAFSDQDPNGTARLLLLPMILCASAGLERRLLSLSGWLALGLGGLTLLLTQSRTTLISFSAGLAVVGLLNLPKKRLWWIAAPAAVAMAAVALTVDFQTLFAEGGERFTPATLIGRTLLWDGALDIVRENPWFGAFPSGYFQAMQRHGLLLDDVVNSAHSLYLGLAAEWGVALVGVALFVMFATVRRGWNAVGRAHRRPEALEARVAGVTAVALTVTYAVHGIDENVPPLFLFLALGLAVAASNVSEASPPGDVVR
jgi:hypothetical protein